MSTKKKNVSFNLECIAEPSVIFPESCTDVRGQHSCNDSSQSSQSSQLPVKDALRDEHSKDGGIQSIIPMILTLIPLLLLLVFSYSDYGIASLYRGQYKLVDINNSTESRKNQNFFINIIEPLDESMTKESMLIVNLIGKVFDENSNDRQGLLHVNVTLDDVLLQFPEGNTFSIFFGEVAALKCDLGDFRLSDGPHEVNIAAMIDDGVGNEYYDYDTSFFFYYTSNYTIMLEDSGISSPLQASIPDEIAPEMSSTIDRSHQVDATAAVKLSIISPLGNGFLDSPDLFVVAKIMTSPGTDISSILHSKQKDISFKILFDGHPFDVSHIVLPQLMELMEEEMDHTFFKVELRGMEIGIHTVELQMVQYDDVMTADYVTVDYQNKEYKLL